MCGICKCINNKKQTDWWTDEIKKQVKTKKRHWKRYLSKRTPENYEKYKEQRKIVKNLITEAKQNSWKDFGEKLETDSKGNQKLFYKILKNLRSDRKPQLITINDKAGNILTDEKEIMERWKEHFDELFNMNKKEITPQNERKEQTMLNTQPRNRTDHKMKDSARNRTTNNGSLMKKQRWRKNTVRVACWNVMSWATKDNEILLELEQHKIDICAISKLKRKGKGSVRVPGYTLVYSGVPKHKRATAGVGLLISEKFAQSIENICYLNERILTITLNVGTEKLHLISVYAPDTGKGREETASFYETLETAVTNIPPNEKLLIMGDLNARVGKEVLPGIKHHFNEHHINDNGEALIEFCAHHSMRINTFFNHKPQHKITWQNSRGQSSTIDYIISNRAIHPTQILDVRGLTSANIGSDHSLVLCRLRMGMQGKRNKQNITKEKLNIESINDLTTRDLYQRRLSQKIEANHITEVDDVEHCWKKLQTNIMDAANEALGKRKVGGSRRAGVKQWYTPEVKALAEEKRKAYIRYRSNQTPEERSLYVQIRNRTTTEIRNIKREYWERFSSEMENDLYGAQRKVWGMLRRRKQDITEYTQTQQIDEATWKRYFEELYATNIFDAEEEEQAGENAPNTDTTTTKITTQMITESTRRIKNRKAPGLDDIPNELLKHGGERLMDELTKLFNKILTSKNIPNEWKRSITVPIFKKGDKKSPENYRGITLLSSVMKLFTKNLEPIIGSYVGISEEQQGFRKNRSTLDATFIIRQIVEKSIEYGKPAFMCFVDLTKAFDRVRLSDVVNILKQKQVPNNLIEIVKQLNLHTSTHISVNRQLTEAVPTPTGIRQGDSLSPLLFNTIMDQIIDHIKNSGNGYKLTTGEIKIVCYADDAVLITENENDLQRLLHSFFLKARSLNMQISTAKTKSLVIAKEPIRCKLVVEDNPIEQVMAFNYLGVEVSSSQDRTHEVRSQTNKACRISGALRDVIWCNKFMSKQAKVRIYKTCVRPIMTYAMETRADNKRTKNILRTTEMKVLRNISGYTLRDRIRNKNIRDECQVLDVARWGRQRRRQWNEHISRMENDRVARIARDGIPGTRRPLGRPPKRWKDSWVSTSNEN